MRWPEVCSLVDRMSHKRHTRKGNRGQVALEYFLATLVVLVVTSLSWVFYQRFVQGNLYGGLALGGDSKAMGLETAVSLPFP